MRCARGGMSVNFKEASSQHSARRARHVLRSIHSSQEHNEVVTDSRNQPDARRLTAMYRLIQPPSTLL
jgi:hypothetical protein